MSIFDCFKKKRSIKNSSKNSSELLLRELPNSEFDIFYNIEFSQQDSFYQLKSILGDNYFIQTLSIKELSTQSTDDDFFDMMKIPDHYFDCKKGVLNQTFFEDFNNLVISRWKQFYKNNQNNNRNISKDDWLKFIRN
ncbi:hypothetical protein [Haemophilus haemolyticus]|uniref:hypothetical protein n=1 Tax=Haemophilus haemolyticus TaxID=726 RepID=UPI000E580ED9|nr:hypothetical protein [Haemophilus haemolyticus]